MANFVALELNDDSLLVASAKSSGRDYEINNAFSIEIAPDSTDAQISDRLKDALTRHGILRSEAIFVVNRLDVEIREISVPPAPDNELPEMVRFQARNEFASLNDSWALDFVPFDGIEDGPRRVLATAISPQLTGQLNAIVDSAGLKLKRILFRPYAVCDLLQSKLADGKSRLIVDPNEDQIDLTITSGNALNATRSLSKYKAADSEARIKQLLGEAKRTLASSSAALGGKRIDEIIVCGSSTDYQELSQHLTDCFDCPVVCADPVRIIPSSEFSVTDMPARIESFASLFGALGQEYWRKGHRLDFLHPRKQIVRKIDHKRTTMYGALAACLALIGVFFAWWALSSQNKKLESLDNQLTQLRLENEGKNGEPGVDQVVGEVALIDVWKIWDIDWLDELSELSQRFMTSDDAIVDHFSAELGKQNAQFVVKGRMSQISSGAELTSQLARRPYTVKNGPTRRLDDDNDYQLSYEKILSLELDRKQAIRKIDDLARQRRMGKSQTPVDSSNENDSGPE